MQYSCCGCSLEAADLSVMEDMQILITLVLPSAPRNDKGREG